MPTGGTQALRQVAKTLPFEDIRLYGDTITGPSGSRDVSLNGHALGRPKVDRLRQHWQQKAEADLRRFAEAERCLRGGEKWDDRQRPNGGD